MVNNEYTLNARVSDLEKQVSELKGQVANNNQAIANSNRLTIWQFISFTLVMAGTLFGTLAWISNSLREELRANRDYLQSEIKQTRELIQQTERNMNNRFEDLRQVVLSQQKQAPKK
ncbi:MAG: hypothetical protein AAB401_23960 [Acidobacteriota bacterium]